MANILVVGPHPDDQELGMGGTIALLADQGHRILLLDMTNGEPTPFGSPEIRAREADAALAALCPPVGSRGRVERVCINLPNRVVEHCVEARHLVAAVIRAHQASIVFVPYFEDAHPDHVAVTRIAEDARFDAKLTRLALPAPPGMYHDGAADRPAAGHDRHPAGVDGLALDDTAFPPLYPKWFFHYYATHLRIVPSPSFIVDVSATIERKVRSILAYESQFVLNERNRAVVEWVRASATYFGSRIGTSAGEAFFAREPIGLGSLASLA